MDGGIQGEINFHVPFQIVHDRAGAADAFYKVRIIAHGIGEHVPVAGRSFGVGAVRPKLGEHAREIAAPDDVGRIGLAGEGIGRMSGAIIGSERVVPECAG